ncbi:MAG: ABC transporter permease, partial [Mesotoga sp.]|nr:ABC transporter permease [Mesotoga sp.]
MLRDALIIFRKELKNVFKDGRTIFAVLILPMLIMPVIFLVINTVSTSQAKSFEETVYEVNLVNLPDERFEGILTGLIKYRAVQNTNKEAVLSRDNYLIVEFPA